MRLLDLFCGAGGAAVGYHRAGFDDIVGVDIEPQPNYPFTFVRMDAMKAARLLMEGSRICTEFLGEDFGLENFDAIHASPPCQRYSSITRTSGRPDDHPDLIGPTRDLLESSGKVWVIENVPRAPLRDPVLLCGLAFGLRHGKYVLRRHRLFESNVLLLSNGCRCYRGDGVTMGVYGGGMSLKERNPNSSGGRPYKGTSIERREIMGMPWVKCSREVNEAIPPAYAEFVGLQLIQACRQAGAA